jgi:hypothetical protein
MMKQKQQANFACCLFDEVSACLAASLDKGGKRITYAL